MSITANKFPGVRAALCVNTETTRLSREHNNANVLCLGSLHTDELKATDILNVWLETAFAGDRHKRRIDKINSHASEVDGTSPFDKVIRYLQTPPTRGSAAKRKYRTYRLRKYYRKAVREVQGSRMTNKYAEGYPGKRWYNGCEWVDGAETLAIQRAKELFGAEHANVQPHSGSGANMAVTQLQPGDTILAMSLAEGGHLTHGHPMNFSGRLFNIVPYGVNQETEQIDYENIQKLAKNISLS